MLSIMLSSPVLIAFLTHLNNANLTICTSNLPRNLVNSFLVGNPPWTFYQCYANSHVRHSKRSILHYPFVITGLLNYQI